MSPSRRTYFIPCSALSECGTYYTYDHTLGYMEDDTKLERVTDEGAPLLLALGISDRELSDKVKASLTLLLKPHGFRLVYRANPWAWYHWRDECVQLIDVRTVDRHGFYAGYCAKMDSQADPCSSGAAYFTSSCHAPSL